MEDFSVDGSVTPGLAVVCVPGLGRSWTTDRVTPCISLN
jgi:hypothetical protein